MNNYCSSVHFDQLRNLVFGRGFQWALHKSHGSDCEANTPVVAWPYSCRNRKENSRARACKIACLQSFMDWPLF